MNLREYVILDVLNIASAVFQRNHEFQASAAEMVEIFNSDPRYEAERRIMGFGPRSMGTSLGRLANRPWPSGREPLVERVGKTRWRLTRAGVRVLSA